MFSSPDYAGLWADSFSHFTDWREPACFVTHCICCLETQTTYNTYCTNLALWFNTDYFSLFLSLVLSSEGQPTGGPVQFLGIIYMWHVGQAGFQSQAVAMQEQYRHYKEPHVLSWDVFLPMKDRKGISENNETSESWKNTAIKRTSFPRSSWTVSTVKPDEFEIPTPEMSFLLSYVPFLYILGTPVWFCHTSYFCAQKILMGLVQDYVVNNWLVPDTVYFI